MLNDTSKWTLISRAVVAGLPADITERRETLDALHQLVPQDHPLYPQVSGMLLHLDSHRLSVREFGQQTLKID